MQTPQSVDSPTVIPDLLNAEPRLRIDTELLRDNLPFAFVSGDSNGSIERAVSDMEIGESAWNPSSFQDELFLTELVDLCMRARHEKFEAPLNHKYLGRVISRPPRDRCCARAAMPRRAP